LARSAAASGEDTPLLCFGAQLLALLPVVAVGATLLVPPRSQAATIRATTTTPSNAVIRP
jgi:hypothetical protein